MNAMPDPISPVTMARSIGGWLLKYVACNALTMVVLLCFGALLVLLAVLVEPGGPLHLLQALHPAAATGSDKVVHVDSHDANRYVGWGYFAFGCVLTAIAVVRRELRRARHGAPAPAATSVSQHLNLHMRRRLAMSFGIVSVIYACALVAVPFMRVAHGSSRLGMFDVLVVLYVTTLVFTAIFEGLNLAADWVLDG